MTETPSSFWSLLGWGACGHPHTWPHSYPAVASPAALYFLHLWSLWLCHCNAWCTGPDGPVVRRKREKKAERLASTVWCWSHVRSWVTGFIQISLPVTKYNIFLAKTEGTIGKELLESKRIEKKWIIFKTLAANKRLLLNFFFFHFFHVYGVVCFYACICGHRGPRYHPPCFSTYSVEQGLSTRPRAHWYGQSCLSACSR